ncbi:hypothetical protein BGZ83_010072, partial [Gryganskiella cystojenkinii]
MNCILLLLLAYAIAISTAIPIRTDTLLERSTGQYPGVQCTSQNLKGLGGQIIGPNGTYRPNSHPESPSQNTNGKNASSNPNGLGVQRIGHDGESIGPNSHPN